MEMDWEKRLREEGYLEFDGFRVELTLDNTFMELDYIPRIIVYDGKTGRWHVLRNSIPKGETLDEGWDNAVEVLGRIARGEEKPLFGDEGVAERFVRALKSLVDEDNP